LHTESFLIDLGGLKSIDRIVLYPRNDTGNAGVGFPVDFTIDITTDAPQDPGDQTGSTFKTMWKTVVTQVGYTNPSGTAQTFNIPQQFARYVRVKATKLGGPIPAEGNKYRFQLAEVEIDNSNIYRASNGFSSSQGQDQWYYQQWTGSSYQDMTWIPASNWWQGSNSCIYIGNSNQSADIYDSVRKWVAPKTGYINITGHIYMNYWYPGADGVIARILHGSTLLWSQTIANGNVLGSAHNIREKVSKGEAIYFIVNDNSQSVADSTAWNPEITYDSSIQFFDDFSAGDSIWTKNSGTWAVETGEFSQSDNTISAYASEPALTIGDGVVKMDIKINSTYGTDYWSGFSVRKTNPNDTYVQSGYLVYIRPNGKVGLYKNGSAWQEISTGFDPTAGFVTLKAELKGSQINVYVNDFPVLSRNDSDFTSGYISPVTYFTHTHFDNITVSGGAGFSDNFTSGSDNQWVKYAGTWAVESGELSQSSTSGGALAGERMVTAGNGSVSMNLKIISTSGVDNWAGVFGTEDQPE
jgi:hypothetical protein